MENDYTLNKLVKIIYGEASFEEYFQLDDEMQADPALRIEFRQLYDSFKSMPKANLKPSETSIHNILNYSKEQLRSTLS